jgi:excisionase family DNA binding protein
MRAEENVRREEWLTVHELATEFRVHSSTITRLIEAGEVEAFKIGARRWRIPRGAWEDYLARRRGPTPAPHSVVA